MSEAQATVNDENKKPMNRRPVRGKTAALLGNLNESDDSDVDASSSSSSVIGKTKKAGIYSQKLTQTKLEIKDLHHKFEAKILVEKDLTHKNKLVHGKHDSDSDDDDNVDNDAISLVTSKTHEKDSHPLVKRKKSTQDKSESDDDSPPSSPPPPPTFAETKSKRKSATLIDRQLKELEKLKNDTKIKKILNDSKDKSNAYESDDDIINTIKVKVSTINGVWGWEIGENETFEKIFEEVAKKEKINVERVILMLNDHRINYSDTPASINLKITDILDFSKAPEVIQEKIRIIDNQAQDNDETPPNKIKIIFQTQEGRKSRLKFLIAKDEKFANVLEKYCQKMNLDQQMHIIEFDGDQVNLNETPNDLDLDGDEIFDVRKSSKPIMAKVAEKKKVYEFDDDILIV